MEKTYIKSIKLWTIAGFNFYLKLMYGSYMYLNSCTIIFLLPGVHSHA